MMFFEWVQSVSAVPTAGGGATAGLPVAASPAALDQNFPTSCPKCRGPLWDNRARKKGNQPDFKCKDKSCGKGIWLEPYQP